MVPKRSKVVLEGREGMRKDAERKRQAAEAARPEQTKAKARMQAGASGTEETTDGLWVFMMVLLGAFVTLMASMAGEPLGWAAVAVFAAVLAVVFVAGFLM